jgi:predicted NBD/HSP70 family sugar kinase
VAGLAERGTIEPRDIRVANLSRVLRHVSRHGARSRARLAAETGLDRSTVSSLVQELIERRLLRETHVPERPGRIGRPAQLVAPDAGGVAAIGLEINVEYVAACAMDLGGGIRAEARVELACAGAEPATVVQAAAQLADELFSQVTGAGMHVLAVTLALPGLVDVASGRLVTAPNLGWSDIPTRELLREAIADPRLSLAVDNEANLAAVAEHWNGAGSHARDLICVTGAIGVGAGVIVGGRLLRGSHGFGGEIGHVTIDPSGRPCACGAHGCLETVAGAGAVTERAGIALPAERGLAELLRRARVSEPQTLAALTDAGVALGIALASVANVLDPEAIILGGWMTPLAEWLVPPIRSELRARVLGSGSVSSSECELLPAAHGPQAAVRGAAIAGLEAVLADPTLAIAA